ncbi:probable plastid-lipid-associated protein 10, chloroplastic [Vigna radiata var. radiata]|uniref:Probable plastid-lipid-associated protein 10, chloroplastic n=1 Tax=Vigna radiata var. radiata TaxID=3916 RepID=A0A1S3TFP1_VIGRR|nr:probable plastid-lipid-associated protein 10, chloroplastic [Vigna radiata var. radiata]XP_014492587.1 probable plastid-lipid-associated protein 10, chloroplastic [Vigna radiata var. radiata]XP_014492588.1 probable plastid-lipid-associated protein 10, chloroplastic [Vigna radiata var. radiata]
MASIFLTPYLLLFIVPKVGQIFQKIECRDPQCCSLEYSKIVRDALHKGLLLMGDEYTYVLGEKEQEGATLLVSAKFNVVSVRNIYLQFQEEVVGAKSGFL